MCGLDRHQTRLAAQRDDGSVDSPAGCLFNVYFHLLVRLLFISYIYDSAAFGFNYKAYESFTLFVEIIFVIDILMSK